MLAVARTIDRFIDFVGRLVAWLTLGLVLVGVVVVGMRYGLSIVYTWLQESQVYMYGTIFLIGAAFALQHNRHVRLDFLYSRFSESTKRVVEIGGNVFFIIPFCCLVLYHSYDYVINSWIMLESSQHMRGLPAVFLLKSLIWVFAIGLALQAISNIIKDLAFLKGGGDSGS